MHQLRREYRNMGKFLLILTIVLIPAMAWSEDRRLTVEAASPDPTLVVRGLEKEIAAVDDPQWTKSDNALFLFTSSYGKRLIKDDSKQLVAVAVDAESRVIAVANSAVDRSQPGFDQAIDLPIPEGGCVLVATDDDYPSRGYKKFLAENFRVGDLVKFRIGGNVVAIRQIAARQTLSVPVVVLSNEPLTTVVGSKLSVCGQINRAVVATNNGNDGVMVQRDGFETKLRVDRRGNFKGDVELAPGVNYLDIVYRSNGEVRDKQSLIVFRKMIDRSSPEVILWVEQFPNAKKLTGDKEVEEMLQNARNAGFTSIGMDVKGPEGFVSYRKNDLSHSPYITSMANPDKKIKETGFDLLASVLVHAHQFGMKVYASLNFFTEGNVTTGDYGVLGQHKDWEEIVQRPEDKGALLKVSESVLGKEAKSGKRLVLAFVNPVNKEVQDFQLLRVEEILKNYPVDGIVLDRCRYDNLYADFGHVSRNAFSEYLKSKGKKLDNFPDDAFRIDDQGVLVQGKYFVDWITFRSQVVKDFTSRVRQLVEKYRSIKNPELKLAAYVGSWYETYYQNGVNWASYNFHYDSRLVFPESRIYSEEYGRTSYLENLDFLMVGTYYKTEREVKKYITLANVLTCGQLPLLGSMSLPDLKDEERSGVFKASVAESSGLMVFDYCYINDWNAFTQQMIQALKNRKK